jgi:hypothetical protein
MSQIVKLRRSSVSGQKPTNTNLQLGELALNTTDGKVFMAVSGSLGPTVEELISTNTVNTGAINLKGDITASGLRINGDAVISSSLYIGNGEGDFINIKAVISSSLLPDSDGDHHNIGIPNRRWKSVHAATGAFDSLTGFSGGTLNINDAVITGSFTGSFNGDGAQLYNIPASGVTGLSLNKIISGSVSASISPDKGLEINANTIITGSLIVTNGIGYIDTGLIAQNSDLLLTSGSNVIIENGGYVSASYFSGSAEGLINVPFQISGSDISGNTYNKTFTKLQFDDSTGLNVNEDEPGTAFISIGSHFKDIFVSGSEILSATGSDAFEIISQGGIEITTNIVDTNYNGYTKELIISTDALSSSIDTRINTITGSITSLNDFSSSVVLTSQTGSMTVMSASYAVTAAFALNAGAGGGGATLGTYTSLEVTSAESTWSFAHNVGQRYPIFQVFDNNGDVIIPSQIRTIDNYSAQIIFPSPQTGTVIASLGGGNGTTQEFTNSNLWVVDHNLGTDYPDVTIWDSNRNIIFPNRIESIDDTQIKIYFSAPVSGHVSVSRGGHIIDGTASATPGTISGSLQIANLGYATTGSNTFISNQTINGSLSLSNSLFQQTTTTGTTGNVNVATISKTSYDGAFFDYVLKDGTNFRAGSVMSVWDGTTIKYNETTTNDIGDTTGVTMSVIISGGNAVLRAVVSSGTWTFKTITRGI